MKLREMGRAHGARMWFLARYGISGALGGFVQTLVLYVWVSFLGLKDHYLWGVVIGFCIALLISFVLQRHWTFKDRVHHHMMHTQFIFYIAVSLLALGLNALLLHLSKQAIEGLGLDFFNGWYIGAQIIIIFAVATVTFLLNYFVTFRRHQEEHE